MGHNDIQRICRATRRDSYKVSLLSRLTSCRGKCNSLLNGDVPASLPQQAGPCRLDCIMSVLDRSTCTRVAMRSIYVQWLPAKALCRSWCILTSQSRSEQWKGKTDAESTTKSGIGNEHSSWYMKPCQRSPLHYGAGTGHRGHGHRRRCSELHTGWMLVQWCSE
eukprot:6475099-Amphidinium_carterae.2